MDLVTAISTVYSLSTFLINWLDQRKQKHLDVLQISHIVDRIHKLLAPLNNVEIKIDQYVFDCVRCIGDALQHTKEHLLLWDSKGSRRVLAFLKPRLVIDQLKEDQQILNQQLIMLLTVIAVNGYIRENSELKAQVPSPLIKHESEPEVLQPIENVDVRRFWQDYVGTKNSFIQIDIFFAKLEVHIGRKINEQICSKLAMRLDEYGVGGVTPWNLSRLVGEGNLSKTVEEYHDMEHSVPLPIFSISDRQIFIIWIDDRPEEVEKEVEFAHSLGIQVIQLESTSEAKSWIDSNDEFLRENDHPSRLRIISDNVRLESHLGASEYLNPTAGESILRYVRGRQYNIPILIYTGASIDTTTYVLDYDMAGSTSDPDMCMQFLAALAHQDDDLSWRAFSAIASE